jgi:heat shock protein HslJ
MSARPRRVVHRFFVVSAVVASLAVASCGEDLDGREDPDDIVEHEQVQLAGKTYESTSVTGFELVPETVIRLAFEDDTMAVSAGCNTMSAAWTDADGELVWAGPIASTLMACPPELAAQDEWLIELFSDGVEITDGDADLTLESGDVAIELDEQ